MPARSLGHRVVMLNCVDPWRGNAPAVRPRRARGRPYGGRACCCDAASRARVYVVGRGPDPRGDRRAAAPRRGARAARARSASSSAGVDPVRVGRRTRRTTRCSEAAPGRSRPAALVCLNDRIAMGAYQALAERGLRVPDDVAVVSFDGSELAGWLRPTVTSVALPFAEMGASPSSSCSTPGTTARVQRLVPMPLVPADRWRAGRHRQRRAPRVTRTVAWPPLHNGSSGTFLPVKERRVMATVTLREGPALVSRGRQARGPGHRPRDRGRRVHGPRRAVGVRQVHDPADARGARGGQRRQDLHR